MKKIPKTMRREESDDSGTPQKELPKKSIGKDLAKKIRKSKELPKMEEENNKRTKKIPKKDKKKETESEDESSASEEPSPNPQKSKKGEPKKPSISDSDTDSDSDTEHSAEDPSHYPLLTVVNRHTCHPPIKRTASDMRALPAKKYSAPKRAVSSGNLANKENISLSPNSAPARGGRKRPAPAGPTPIARRTRSRTGQLPSKRRKQ